jgi:dimethylamine monooxygenase subunit A
MRAPILQSRLPHLPWMDPRLARLPGVLPLGADEWLVQDEAYGAQMAERDRLIAGDADLVYRQLPEGRGAARELYDLVLPLLAAKPGFTISADAARRPDGAVIALDAAEPLKTLGLLLQEDLCIMEREAAEHRLTGAILCFPASWHLHEKIGRPLVGIHRTVDSYDNSLAARVQRMFDMIRPEAGLWRMNHLVYRDPALHQPRRESDPRTDRRGGAYLRAERQCFMRLPISQAVVFSIHTYVVPLDTLPSDAVAALGEARL